jgi:hypothetical protein
MEAKTKKIILWTAVVVFTPSVFWLGYLGYKKFIAPSMTKSKKDDKGEVAKPPAIAPASTETPKLSQQNSVGNPAELYDKLVATRKAKPSRSKEEFVSRYNTFTDTQKNLIISLLLVYLDSRPYQVALKDYEAIIKSGKDSGKYTNKDINAPDDFVQYIYL